MCEHTLSLGRSYGRKHPNCILIHTHVPIHTKFKTLHKSQIWRALIFLIINYDIHIWYTKGLFNLNVLSFWFAQTPVSSYIYCLQTLAQTHHIGWLLWYHQPLRPCQFYNSDTGGSEALRFKIHSYFPYWTLNWGVLNGLLMHQLKEKLTFNYT